MLGVQFSWVYQRHVTFTLCKGLTKHEYYKALTCNKFQ